MNTRRYKYLLLLFTILALLSSPLAAATFIVPSDEHLVGKARAIAVGTVTDTHSRTTPEGGIETVSLVSVEEGIKGGIRAGEVLEIVHFGGAIGSTALVVPGTPEYQPGTRVLVFLVKNRNERWTTLDLALGRFQLVEGNRGQRHFVRDERGVHAWDQAGRPHHESPRDADRFLNFVRGIANGRPMARDYVAETAEATVGGSEEPVANTMAAGAYPPSAYLSTITMNGVTRPARWASFGSGAVFRNRGTQPGYADGGVGAIQAGLAAWTNEPASNVNYVYGGTTSATYGLNGYDTVNSVQMNDPNNEIAGSFNGSGTLGVGGYWVNGQTNTHAGETFYTVTYGDVVIQDGVSSANLNANKFNQLLAHELGHTLGFRHADQGTPSSTAAIMRSAVVQEFGATLQPYDLDAVQTVYGSGSVPPPAITISSISPASGAGTGQVVTLTGSGFQSGAVVRFGALAAGSTNVQSSTQITATTPGLQGGTFWTVTVTNPGGTAAAATRRFFANYFDVPASHPYRAHVEAITREQITGGCTPNDYCPAGTLTRAQMSVFILRAKHGRTYNPPAATGTRFTDVPAGSFAAAWIERMAAEGITGGCSATQFCPNMTVPRQQMAVFLLTAKYGSGYSPPAARGIFSDVPTSSIYARWIEDAVNKGFMRSCASGRFCPTIAVRRDEMAQHLTSTFSIALP